MRQYYFGIKLHIRVDAETGTVHSMENTSANVHDVTQAGKLLHGGEWQVWGEAGYKLYCSEETGGATGIGCGMAGGAEAWETGAVGMGESGRPGGAR